MPTKLLYTTIFGFGVGVFTESFVPLEKNIFLVVFLFSIFSLSLFFFLKNKTPLLISAFLMIFMLGSIRYKLDQETPRDVVGKISVEGVINDEVENRENSQRFVLKTESLGNVLVSTDLYPKYEYGDIVFVSGEVKSPKNFITENGKDFDYINYLAKDEIFYKIDYASVKKVGHKNPSFLRGVLFSAKNRLEENIQDVVPEPKSAFLAGISFGSRDSIPDSLREKFIETGTIHIVALSGYNISIIAKGIQETLSYFLPLYKSLFFGALGVVFFVLMTGAQSTAVRAGIMALIVLFGRGVGRTYDITRALFIAGFFMVLVNPMILRYDISFQLSFIATLGIVHITPVFEKLFKVNKNIIPKSFFEKIKFFFKDIVVTTLSAQVAVLPFIVYKMGTLSIVSFPVNILILPFIPISMYLGFIISVLGFLGKWASLPFAYIVDKILSLVLFVIDKSSGLKFSSLDIYNFSIFGCLIVYVFIICMILYLYRKNKQKIGL